MAVISMAISRRSLSIFRQSLALRIEHVESDDEGRDASFAENLSNTRPGLKGSIPHFSKAEIMLFSVNERSHEAQKSLKKSLFVSVDKP